MLNDKQKIQIVKHIIGLYNYDVMFDWFEIKQKNAWTYNFLAIYNDIVNGFFADDVNYIRGEYKIVIPKHLTKSGKKESFMWNAYKEPVLKIQEINT